MSANKAAKRGRGRPPITDPEGASVSLRFSSSELESIDAYASRLVPGVKLSRHDAIRSLVQRGLVAVQKEGN